MSKKLFFFDTETTGLDPEENDIISLSYIIEIGGEIKKEGTFLIKPFNWGAIQPAALMVNGFTIHDLQSHDDPHFAHAQLTDVFSDFVDRYNPLDKFYPVAYNAQFDMQFLAEFFKKCGDDFFGSWFNGKALDPLPMLRYLDYLNVIQLADYKLLTVANNFGISHTAHDSMSDTKALYGIFHRISGIYTRDHFITKCTEEDGNS